MNVAALIFALIGAGLSFFQGFVIIPFLELKINIYNIWGFILSHLSETWNLISSMWNNLSGFKEKAIFVIVFLFVLSLLFTPLDALLQGCRAFLRQEAKEEDDKPWRQLRNLSVICVIAAAILYLTADALIRTISEKIGEGEMITGQLFPAHLMFLSYVPLIWAVCFGIASMCAFADMQEQNKQKQISIQLNKIQENISNLNDSKELKN